MDITILGIESSCDDTSAAVIRNTTLLSNVIASQAVHMKYGGVIPELASRAHQQNIVPVVDTALKEALAGKCLFVMCDLFHCIYPLCPAQRRFSALSLRQSAVCCQ